MSTENQIDKLVEKIEDDMFDLFTMGLKNGVLMQSGAVLHLINDGKSTEEIKVFLEDAIERNKDGGSNKEENSI